jgi:hypothetical protein
MRSSTIRKWLRLSLAAGLGALLALPAVAQEDALKAFPGYVDFGELNSIFGEPTVQISIGKSLLGLVSTLSAEEDPQAAELFRKLNGVRVNVFETEGMAAGAFDLVKDIAGKLSTQGWESVVTVNSADEQLRVFIKLNGETVDGITVMAIEDTEAVFVNVIGNINPADLQRVMDNFDVNIGSDGVEVEE